MLLPQAGWPTPFDPPTNGLDNLVLPILLVLVLYVAFLMSFTWETMTLTAIAYLSFLPFSVRAWLHRYGAQERAQADAERASAGK